MQSPARRGTNSLGSSRNQHDFAVHAALQIHSPLTAQSNTSMSAAPPSRESMGLPEPSAEARAHSERVVAHVVKAIAERGWISFADYMGAVLYAPGLGYYTAGARKFGAGGDFVTAPEMSPLFGRALATQVGQILDSVPDAEVIELGPGTGRLAGEMLSALGEGGRLPVPYRLLEVSADLR